MKAFMAITICVFALAVVGCVSCHRSINTYRISIVNTGTQNIWVTDFKLYESHGFATALGGELLSKQKMGSGPYDKKPFRQILVEWKVMETGAMASQTVDVELPEQFADYRAGIMFYIDPDNKRVYVAYDLHDDTKGIDLIVDSNGKPFDIKSVKRQ